MQPGLSPFIKCEAHLAEHIDALVTAHPQFEPIRHAAGEVTLRWMDEGFPGLVWVITGQQISVAAGRAIYNRCEAALGSITPETILAADDACLKAAGFSAPKMRTLRAVAEAAATGTIDMAGLAQREAEDAIAHLTAVKGIGPWTAEVYLIFATGHPDVFPAKDVALQEAARLAFDLDTRPTDKTLKLMSDVWRPYRSAAARLLWAYYRARKMKGDAPVR